MALDETPAHSDGEIVSAKADENGVIRVESYQDGEIRTHVFDREGFMQDGVYHPPPQAPLLVDDPAAPHHEGEIVSARVNENGDVEVHRFVDGEIRSSTHADEPFMERDGRLVHPDDPPIPATVDPYSSVKVLDDVVHDMALDAHRDGEIIGATKGDDGVVRVETWLDGERHTSSFDREGYMQDGVYHPPADVAAGPSAEASGPHYEGQIISARVEDDGTIRGERVVDGEVRGFGVGYEPVMRAPHDQTSAQDPPAPTQVELAIATEDGAGAHAAVIDAASGHEPTHDESSMTHHDPQTGSGAGHAGADGDTAVPGE